MSLCGAGMAVCTSELGDQYKVPEKVRCVEISVSHPGDRRVIQATAWEIQCALRMPYMPGVCEREPQSITWL